MGERENVVTGRAVVLLAGLAGVALVLALLVSLFVPPEWSGGLALPEIPLRFVPGPLPQGGPAPALTPGPATTPTPPDRLRRDRPRGFGSDRTGLAGFAGRVATDLLLLVAGLILLYTLRRRLGRIAATVRGGPLALVRLGLVGLAGYLILGVLGLLSVTSLLGAPAWLLLGVAVYGASLVGLVAVSLPLGRALLRRAALPDQPAQVDLLAGLLIIAILSLLPLVGSVVLLLLAALGFGAVLQARGGSEYGWDFDLRDVQY